MQDLSASEIESILDAAASFKKSKTSKALAGRVATLIFSEPSTSTRSSFEIAARRLSAEVLGFSTASSSLLKGETLLDTIWNLEAMGVEYFVVRHEVSGILEELAPRTKASLINAGDGAHEHPTQALLDILTLREKKGALKGLKVVIVGDILHSRVARSNIHGLKKLGAKVTVCGPRALVPSGIESLGAAVSHDLDAALSGADAVNVLRLQLERQKENFVTSLPDYYAAYGVTAERLSKIPGCAVLHPGPMNRGVEIESAAADGPQSAILEQVSNGVLVRMAVLALIEEWRSHAG
ncbi:MAG: aspartate carbamoyltransferase catalytic subunit [Elusimicrobia bacterium]|nr:aspartate carbamoyltransferase catalytic subunit [Elusimicrobiota bacterium]